MAPEEIQKAIKLNGTTQKAIAKKLKKSEMIVSQVINKKTISDYVMRGVAKAINKKHTEVFPEYYLGPKRRSTSKIAKRESEKATG